MSDRTNKSGGGLFTFIVGIAAGAAAGYYLSTEEGRRMRSKLSERTQELTSDASVYARETSTKVQENVNAAVDQSRVYVNDLSETVKSRVEDLTESAKAKAKTTSNSFQDGINRGRAKLDQQKAEIEDLVQNQVEDKA